MAGPSDIRFCWFRRLTPRDPVVEPSLGIDDFEDAHSLEIRNRALSGEGLLQGGPVDDAISGEASSEHAVPDVAAKMIE